MIELIELTKSYGRVRAVDDVTFTAVPGRVTGFLGLNGCGKTTTLRMLLGLTRPTSGRALINKVRFRELRHPARRSVPSWSRASAIRDRTGGPT